jgi:chromosome segregation ATPase
MELRSAREQITRLEARVREAVGAADRHGEEAEELRQRIAELTSRGGGGAGADERAAWRERVTELEQEADSLRRRLEQRDADAGEALRSRIAELETEADALNDRVVQLQELAEEAQAEARAAAAAIAARAAEPAEPAAPVDDGRVAELEAELESARQRFEAREASLVARVERLEPIEAEAEMLRARVDSVGREVGEPLRARIAELEEALAAAPETAAAASSGDVGAAFTALEEVSTLRAEADQLRAELAERTADLSELSTLRARIGELQDEVRSAREHAENGARTVASANGMEELQTESARLKWRNSYLATRIHFLETRQQGGAQRSETEIPADADGADGGALVAAREEIARQSAKIAELEKATLPDRSGQPAPNVEQGGGSLEWRNRYLASRVRYLEKQLEERLTNAPAAGDDDLRFKLAEQEEKLKDMTKLRARVSELERSAEHELNGDEEGGAKAENQRALEWRIRYLSSRVKYLEDRLAKAGAPVEPSDLS